MLNMVKTTWGGINLPLQMLKDIDKVLVWRGFTSRAEYVREVVRERLRIDLLYVEEKEEEIKEAKELEG